MNILSKGALSAEVTQWKEQTMAGEKSCNLDISFSPRRLLLFSPRHRVVSFFLLPAPPVLTSYRRLIPSKRKSDSTEQGVIICQLTFPQRNHFHVRPVARTTTGKVWLRNAACATVPIAKSVSTSREYVCPVKDRTMEEFKTCSYMDEMYKSGDEVCQADRCVICRDGEWQEEPIA